MKVVGDAGNGYDWVGHGMSAIGKKAVVSDEWLVARSTCECSRVLKQTLEPRASASAIRGMAANYFLWFVVVLCALVAPVLGVAGGGVGGGGGKKKGGGVFFEGG